MLVFVLEDVGLQVVQDKIGVDLIGLFFNLVIVLELYGGKLFSLLVNVGVIVIISLINVENVE